MQLAMVQIHITLNVYENALKKGTLLDSRLRIEHAQVRVS